MLSLTPPSPTPPVDVEHEAPIQDHKLHLSRFQGGGSFDQLLVSDTL